LTTIIVVGLPDFCSTRLNLEQAQNCGKNGPRPKLGATLPKEQKLKTEIRRLEQCAEKRTNSLPKPNSSWKACWNGSGKADMEDELEVTAGNNGNGHA
jgi:hypothetical protein